MWFSVFKKLPEEEQIVIVRTNRNIITEAYYKNGSWFTSSGVKIQDGNIVVVWSKLPQ